MELYFQLTKNEVNDPKGPENTICTIMMYRETFLFFQGILLIRAYFSLLQVLLCRLAAVKGLPVHHYSADYIFWSFGIIEFIFSHLPVLRGEVGVAHFTTGS